MEVWLAERVLWGHWWPLALDIHIFCEKLHTLKLIALCGLFIKFFRNVTIGQANRGERKGYPTINNNVWIGTGSVIVGNINIGDNVLIAPNSYVNIDIPAFSIVMGNPCKIIKKDDPTLGYINHILEI